MVSHEEGVAWVRIRFTTAAALVSQGDAIVPIAIANLLSSETGLANPGEAKALAMGMIIIVAVVMFLYAVLQAEWLPRRSGTDIRAGD